MHRIRWNVYQAPRSMPWLLHIFAALIGIWTVGAHGMTDDTIQALRDDTRELFYHGYDNYLAHAFPEDELKPISCKPQTRNRDNPADIGLNDVLGNYSVTLIDALSSLAILASDEDPVHAQKALSGFKSGVQALADLYGDGTEEKNCGSRACGFDLDSKVQVFETNIRGVGGLLSAHLFAIGELPIRGYTPEWEHDTEGLRTHIRWGPDATYNGHLLRLAHDLASRLLPAFGTSTGLPYPRVNLRSGIPFYRDAEDGVCRVDGTSNDVREITETCAAGAGSLVLEFTTLSRLTGDDRFETLAKRAFAAVWARRSPIGLIGGGIDAESGLWTMPPLAGVGAGIDSFFEYAMKSHILLSGLDEDDSDPADYTSDKFLATWQDAHSAVKHHIYRPDNAEKHPYYGQSDLFTGAPRYSWIDNLSAYYPGLLVLAGELSEAVEAHLLFAALWTRYSALPERWHAVNSFIDPNFRHWAGRPEFIESTYYLYQATRDPWYLHVGEMTLRDIRRRCWTPCGWADLNDVISGETRDRMESFFLGETAKYLYLLFSSDHPLNTMDAPLVFTTEGHPLVIPKDVRKGNAAARRPSRTARPDREQVPHNLLLESRDTCPAPAPPLPLTVSNVANRLDLFHAASLAQLHMTPVSPTRPSPLQQSSADAPAISIADVRSPTNYTFYPWTLPQSLIRPDGLSSPIRNPLVSTLTFPNMQSNGVSGVADGAKPVLAMNAVQKIVDGVLINSLSNLRLNMVQQPKGAVFVSQADQAAPIPAGYDGETQEFRIHGIANWALGRDEKVLLSAEALHGVSPVDPHFTRVKDLEMVDILLDVPSPSTGNDNTLDSQTFEVEADEDSETTWTLDEAFALMGLVNKTTIESMLDKLDDAFDDAMRASDSSSDATPQVELVRHGIAAILPTGVGAAPLPASLETTASTDLTSLPFGQLPTKTLFFLDDTLCKHRLPSAIATQYNIVIIKRGECSFNDGLANIPSFAPRSEALQLVIVLSVPEAKFDPERAKPPGEMIRPLLDEVQLTPNGFERRHPIAMAMVEGDVQTVQHFKRSASTLGEFGEGGKLEERPNPLRTALRDSDDGDDEMSPGLVVKRRYWFESMGVPIGNLIVL